MWHPILITIIVLILTHLCSSEDSQTQQSKLDITLRRVRDTTIKAVVKNASNQGIYLLRSDFFDPQSKQAKKVSVYRNGREPALFARYANPIPSPIPILF